MDDVGYYSRMFRRHAHPVSAWSRLLSMPLLLVPMWTRRWWMYVPIGAWFAINPVLAPKATDMDAFATRAMLGEETWSHEPTSDPRVLAVTAVGTATLGAAMVAAYRHRAVAAAVATGAFMGVTLLEWKLFADRYAAGHVQ